MIQTYDVAVIGAGTMGSFACCELARRGLRVIGFDQFIPPHTRGSHSGDTRIFRIAYTEHPDYVPLAQRASELWDRAANEAGRELLTRSGLLSVGSPEGGFIQGVLKSAEIHRLSVEVLSAVEVRRRYPAFALDEGTTGVFEPAAGWIDANLAIATALQLARQAGAVLRLGESVQRWSHGNGHFEITTASGSVLAEKLVVTAGAWTTRLLHEMGLPLSVRRKVLTWVDPIEPELFRPDVFPVFASDQDFFYGFPALGNHGVKIAVHNRPGQSVVNPDHVALEPTDEEAAEPLAIAARLLPGLAGPLPHARNRIAESRTCLYVMTPDEHFLIDRHPKFPGLVFAAGFSGHGFKFAPAIGEALADLVLDGRSRLPIGFLGLRRFGLS